MIALASLFVIVLASLLVTRVATIMLTLTGMSRESARFQARSAFSGVGFTTSESESVVSHPVRRRIIMTMILLGNAGIVSGIAALLLSFAQTSGSGDAASRIFILAGGLFLLFRLASTGWADRALSRVTERALRRWTDLTVFDYAGLLRMTGDWEVGELEVAEGSWLADQSLADLRLPEEGVQCLGIERSDGRWIGAPGRQTKLHVGDVAVLYGRRETLARLDERRRDPAGELDWVRSQVDFTEQYLEQQELDREAEEAAGDDDGSGGPSDGA